MPEELRRCRVERPPGPHATSATSAMPVIFVLVAGIVLGGDGWDLGRSQPEVVHLGESSFVSAEFLAGAPEGDLAEQPDFLGHLPYEEAPAEDLRPVVFLDHRIKLRAAAADAYSDMEAAARADGVTLMPISGFRSVEEQEHIFLEIKHQRGQTPIQRARVSAPPGYSEHHTGYAIDIGDADAPAANLSPDFEDTAAFKWLEEHAGYFGFELSFPRDNPQHVMFEPWHWRFVGDQHSLETFRRARELFEDGESGEFE